MKIKGELNLATKSSASALNNSIFIDSSDNKLKFKDNSGNVGPFASITPWYLDSNAYDVYDDFESYGLGTFTTNAKWTVTNYISNANYAATTTIVNNGYSASSGKDIKLYAYQTASVSGNCYADITTINLSANKHKYFVCRDDGNSTDTAFTISSQSIFGGQTYTIFNRTNTDGSFSIYAEILIIAKGSDQYDIYINGVLVGSVTSGSIQISIRANKSTAGSNNGGQATIHIPFILESKASV
jgi:hypothetical protein